jgi:hypothetical protein
VPLASPSRPAHRMNRDRFHAKLAGYDADQLGKILWTL